MPKPKETQIDELRTLNSPPEVLHLNIGMKGKLHTYMLVQQKAKRKKTQKPSLIGSLANKLKKSKS